MRRRRSPNSVLPDRVWLRADQPSLFFVQRENLKFEEFVVWGVKLLTYNWPLAHSRPLDDGEHPFDFDIRVGE